MNCKLRELRYALRWMEQVNLNHTMVCDNECVSTLFSKATETSETFIVPKVFTFGYPDWFCLKAHDLPFIHAKFHSSSSSSLAST